MIKRITVFIILCCFQYGELFSQTFSQEKFEEITNDIEVCKSSSLEMHNWLKEELPDSIEQDIIFYLQLSYLLNQDKKFNLPLFEESMKLQYEKENTDAAWASLQLAEVFLYNKMPLRAESYAHQILDFYKETTKEAFNYTEIAYYILGTSSQMKQDYKRAVEFYKNSLYLCDKVGKKPYTYVPSLAGIGESYLQMSEYKTAITYFEKYKSEATKNDLTYWGTISNYALCNAYIGNYSISIALGEEVLANIKQLTGEQSPQYITALNNLSVYYKGVGDLNKVNHYILAANEITQKMYKNNDAYAYNYALSLINISDIYASNEMYDEAIESVTKGLSLLDSIGQKNSDLYRGAILSYINYLIYVGIETENYTNAMNTILEQLSEQKEYMQICAELKFRLGECYSFMKDYNRSIPLFDEYLSMTEELSGKYTSNYIKGIECKAFDIYFSGNDKDYYLALKEEGGIIKEFLKTQLYLYSDYEKSNFSDYFNENFNEIIPELIFTAREKDSRRLLKELVYDNSLLFKGLVLNNTRNTVEFLQENHKLEHDTLLSYKKQLDFEKYNKTISDSLQTKITMLERKLRLELSNKDLDSQYFDYNWGIIKDNLSSNDVAIEFLKYPWSIYDNDSIVYSAIAIRGNSKEPIFIPSFMPLTRESELLSFYKNNQKDSLYFHIWNSMIQSCVINPGDHIYFSPSGILHQIPIESLPIGDGKVMSDVYHMHRVSSTRELAMQKEKVRYEKAVLYGNLNYEMTNDEMIAESRVQYGDNKNYFVSRGLLEDSIRGYVWTTLSNTEREVDYISDLLNKNQVTTITYQQNKGNEESFKALSGKGYNIIHLATHGFFYPDTEAQKKDYFKPTFMNASSTYNPDFSMWRSGLVLSGGNRAWKGDTIPDQVEDGILKAQEISELDLRGADLVVLSACQTGLGEITNDGVFGLQRAFKMAGAQTIVMSLTEVDDQTTMAMMNKFYTNLFSGQSKHDAFYNAQRYIRSIKFDPKYWAGWIMLD